MARAVATASGVAMVLRAIGLYGVTPSLVAGRTRELAIRSALGARPGALLGLVLAAGVAAAAHVGPARRVVIGAEPGVGCRSRAVRGDRHGRRPPLRN